MAAPDLSDDLIHAGGRLLAALDDAGLAAQGAAWIYDHNLSDWRFVVASSLVDTMGRSKVYRDLLAVMAKLDLPGDLTINDLHLVSPNSPIFMTVAGAIRIDNGIARFEHCSINGALFDAVVYRWTGPPKSGSDAAKVEKGFKRRIKQLERSKS